MMADMTTSPMILVTSGGSYLDDDCNNSTIDFDYYGEEALLLYIRSFDVFDFIILPVIALVGLLANSCFLFVVWRIRTMRTNLNKYLCTLAGVDICVFVFGLADRYLQYSSPITFDVHSRTLGLAGCPLNLSVELTYYSSLMLVTLISLERYYAVCKPMTHLKFVSGNRTRRQIILAFALAVFFVLLLIPYRGISKWVCVSYPQTGKYDHLPRKVIYCFSDNQQVITFSQVIQAMPFYTALFANCFFYISITYVLNQWQKKHPTVMSNDVKESHEMETATESFSTTTTYCSNSEIVSSVPSISSAVSQEDVGSKNSIYSKSSRRSNVSITSVKLREKSRANQRAVTKMLLITGCVFFICNSPIQFYFTISSILRLFEIYLSPSEYLFTFLQVLLYTNSAINPFIYGVTNRSYRIAFKKALLFDKK